MKKILAAAVVLAALAGCAGAPSQGQVSAIQNACALDAGVRPVVTVLLATPNLATPEQVAAVATARAVIDPICANPSAPANVNAAAALSNSVGQITALVAQLQIKKAAAQ